MRLKKLLIIGLLTTQVVGITACGKSNKDTEVESSASETIASSEATPSDIGETYIDDSGKKIGKAAEDEGPLKKRNEPIYETVGEAIVSNIDEDKIIRDAMENNSNKERTLEETEKAEDVKQEKYEFNGSAVVLETETLVGAVQIYNPADGSSIFEDVVRFGQVYLKIDTSVNEIGYTVETNGNKGYIKLGNGSTVTIMQLHQGNVGTDRFDNGSQVATIQKYMGVNLAGANIIDGIQVDSEIEQLNTYIFNNASEAACIYKTIDGIYIIKWSGVNFGDGEYLKSLVQLTV